MGLIHPDSNCATFPRINFNSFELFPPWIQEIIR